MPVYRTLPMFPTTDEELRGKSWFHWCPNTHLHSRRRMYSVYGIQVDSFGKVNKSLKGWVCMACGLREEPYYD